MRRGPALKGRAAVSGRVTAEERERLGRLVREEWVRWAQEQPDPKPSWLTPWVGLSESMKEVDRRIGERVARAAEAAAFLRAAEMAKEARLGEGEPNAEGKTGFDEACAVFGKRLVGMWRAACDHIEKKLRAEARRAEGE